MELQRVVYRPAYQLETCTRAFVHKQDEDLKPFEYVTPAADILVAVGYLHSCSSKFPSSS